MKPAIVAVGYNRPDGMKRLLDSIGNATYEEQDITLVISIDESNKSNDVEKVALDFEWTHGNKIIRRFPERQGLRKHIIECGDLSETYGAVIILEDDLIVSKDFYKYVCEAHKKYSNNETICGVSLYSYKYNVFTHFEFDPFFTPFDVFLGQMAITWGESWTKEQWGKFKQWFLQHDNKLPKLNVNIPQHISGWTRSWGRYFVSYIVENDLFYVFPYQARSTCFSDYGEHNKTSIPLTYVQNQLIQFIPLEYRFGNVCDLDRYDAFYEKILDDKITIANIPGSKICVDLNNMKTVSGGKQYVLTNSKLRFTSIASYGLSLRPILSNAIYGISGKQLFLYKLPDETNHIRSWKKRPRIPFSLNRLKYEFHDITWRMLFYYTPREFCNRLIDYLRRQ